MAKKCLVLNGPNLNLLGMRQPEIYGKETLKEIEALCRKHDSSCLQFWVQSNSEAEIIDWIHRAILEKFDKIIINPGAFAHYSLAIYDALLCFEGLKIEVHLSDIMEREKFRRKIITGKACDKLICGMGKKGYIMALNFNGDKDK